MFYGKNSLFYICPIDERSRYHSNNFINHLDYAQTPAKNSEIVVHYVMVSHYKFTIDSNVYDYHSFALFLLILQFGYHKFPQNQD